jgi:hypothetical protein
MKRNGGMDCWITRRKSWYEMGDIWLSKGSIEWDLQASMAVHHSATSRITRKQTKDEGTSGELSVGIRWTISWDSNIFIRVNHMWRELESYEITRQLIIIFQSRQLPLRQPTQRWPGCLGTHQPKRQCHQAFSPSFTFCLHMTREKKVFLRCPSLLRGGGGGRRLWSVKALRHYAWLTQAGREANLTKSLCNFVQVPQGL